jgi:hypothetical protein
MNRDELIDAFAHAVEAEAQPATAWQSREFADTLRPMLRLLGIVAALLAACSVTSD